jgi:hypothetical protein
MEWCRGWGAEPRHQKIVRAGSRTSTWTASATLAPSSCFAPPLVPGCALPGSWRHALPHLSGLLCLLRSTRGVVDGMATIPLPFSVLSVFPGCNHPSFARLPLHTIILQLSVLTVAPLPLAPGRFGAMPSLAFNISPLSYDF